MEDKGLNTHENTNAVFGIIATEAVLVLAIILAVITLKYVSPNLFGNVKEFYETYICDKTDVNEVFDAVDGENV